MNAPSPLPVRAARAVFPWVVGAALVGLGASLPMGIAWAFTHPVRRIHPRNPRSLGMRHYRVRLRTVDGIRLSAWYVPAPDRRRARGVVVLCHGYYGNRANMLPQLQFLHAAGYAALLFDFRAHGWSGGVCTTIGRQETDDLRAAIAWITTRRHLRNVPLLALGESMGASVALMVAAEETRIRAVVADSAFARLDTAVAGRFRVLGPLAPLVTTPARRAGERLLGLRCEEVAPEEAIVSLAPRPVLLIHGEEDDFIVPENALRLHEASGGNAALWMVPGAAHCRAVHVAADEYRRRVLDFFDAALAADEINAAARRRRR